jgi:hypothetical protein
MEFFVSGQSDFASTPFWEKNVLTSLHIAWYVLSVLAKLSWSHSDYSSPIQLFVFISVEQDSSGSFGERFGFLYNNSVE